MLKIDADQGWLIDIMELSIISLRENTMKAIKRRYIGLSIVGLACTGFGVIGLSGAVNAEAIAQLNPCPSIYNQEPFRGRVGNSACGGVSTDTVPTDVAPGTVTPGAVPDAMPFPEVLQNPSARIALTDGTVDINLVNDTNVAVMYEVLGNTDVRMLAPNSSVMLTDLPVPLQMTFNREDSGFVTAAPESSEPGMLTLTLTGTGNFDASQAGMIIQESGDVVLN